MRAQVRFQVLTDPKILEPQPELFIRLVPDKDAGTLTIADSGIGMTKADLVNSLGRPSPDQPHQGQSTHSCFVWSHCQVKVTCWYRIMPHRLRVMQESASIATSPKVQCRDVAQCMDASS